MKGVTIGVLAVLLVAIGACATVPTPVPVAGDTASLGQLAGEWGGDIGARPAAGASCSGSRPAPTPRMATW